MISFPINIFIYIIYILDNFFFFFLQYGFKPNLLLLGGFIVDAPELWNFDYVYLPLSFKVGRYSYAPGPYFIFYFCFIFYLILKIK